MRSLFLGFLALFMATSAAFAVADRELLAKQAADAWLVYIDEAKYNEALALAAPDLREAISKEAWDDGLKQVRTPLGAVEKRKLERLFPTTVLPGNIEGDFVVVNYRTTFAGRGSSAIEILVMAPGPTGEDGVETWQVLSFYIE